MTYHRKTKPALWLMVKGSKLVRTAAALHDAKQIGSIGSRRFQFKIRRPLRSLSKKRQRQREQRLYIPEMLEFLRQHPKCMRCGGKTTCCHHWAGRRANLRRQEFWRSSCFACNSFGKEHPAAAREEGWLAPVGKYIT